MRLTVPLFVGCLVFFQTTLADCNDDAEQARRAGDFDRAIEILSRCVNNELTRVARTYFLLGRVSAQQGRYDEAIRSYDKAIQAIPGYVDARVGRGRALTRSGRPDRAIDDFTRALELVDAPESRAPVFYERGLAHELAGNHDDALKDLNAAVAADNDYAEPHAAIGRIQKERGRLQAAIESYSRAIELDPENAEAWYGRAGVYEEQQRDYLAIRDYNRALKLDPTIKGYAKRNYLFLIPLIPIILVIAAG